MKFIFVGIALIIGGFFSNAQQNAGIRGTVCDADTKHPLPNVKITLSQNTYSTNSAGLFIIENIAYGKHKLEFSTPQYDSKSVTINMLKTPLKIEVQLERTVENIREIEIYHQSKTQIAKENASVIYEVSKDFLDKNRENTLMQSLQNLPGIQAMGVGAGQSKPMIRGLGFNRVVVAQNGIKHEAQQWGSDHGLEIDQNDAGGVEIIKGPASILYGSDAIGGIINIRPLPLPMKNKIRGNLNLLAESNNDLLGASLGLEARKNRWFYRARITWNDYGDYKVPTDRISYENYIFELSDRNLRNTAGNEKDASFSFGYADKNFKTETFISNVNAKNGFFANAHGLEVRTSQIDYDASMRDIDLPYHTVNHIKIINNTSWNLNKHHLRLNLGFQNNVREEHSEPIAHGYMPLPTGTLDRRFLKDTYTIELVDEIRFSTKHSLTIGANTEYQDNKIGGWGFLIPSYYRAINGVYAYDKLKLRENLFLHSGFRYDKGIINTKKYVDWYPSQVNNQSVYLVRATDSQLNFNNISAAAGLSYIKGKTNFKINLGRSFRMPLASELSSDGVNYHMFRFEKGNMNLKTETSYQIDAELGYNTNKLSILLTPFVNYFDNYIYLNPTPSYFETLQVYEYTQSKVLRTGGELTIEYRATDKLGIEGSVEYVRSRQKSGPKKNFTLPFSPPVRALVSANYLFEKLGFLEDLRFKADFHWSARQTDIVPPEDMTDGYGVLDISLTTGLNLFNKKERNPKLRLKLNNVFNKVYFDHISFYRMIDVPQPGRNSSVSVTIPF